MSTSTVSGVAYPKTSGSITVPVVGKIYGMVDHELNIYWPSLINGYKSYGFRPTTSITTKLIRNGLRINVASPASSPTIVDVSALATKEKVASIPMQIEIIQIPTGTIKVMPVGDSLTAGADVSNRMGTIATAAGFTITGIGTQGTPPNYEAYGGWSWSSFAGSGSPFWFSGALNFTSYFSSVGDTPDIVTWALGTNDVFDAISYKEMDSAIAAAKSQAIVSIGLAYTLINSLKLSHPSIYNIIYLPTVGTYGPSGFGDHYEGDEQAQHIYHASMHAFRKAFYDEFSGKESDGIYVAELGMLVDPEFGASLSNVTVSSYNAATTNEPTDGLHFGTPGKVEMSAAMLPAICAVRAAQQYAGVNRIATFSTASPYFRAWEYDANVLTEKDITTWEPSVAPGTYNSSVNGGFASPANTSVSCGQFLSGAWVVDPSGDRPARTLTPLSTEVHPSGLFVVDGITGSPYIRINKRSSIGGAWSTVDTTGFPMPTARVYSLKFNNDGTKLAMGKHVTGNDIVCDFNSSTGALSNMIILPNQLPGAIIGTAWNSDGTALCLVSGNTPYFIVYSVSGDIYTKISNPAIIPLNDCRGPAFSPDGTKLAIAVQNTESLIWYDYNGSTLVKRTNPVVMPSGSASFTCWIGDDHLAVGHAGTTGIPYLTTYTVSGGLLVADSAPVALTALNGTITTVVKY